ncbi:MAG: transcriptional regulator GcvA [Rhodospirillales bacterium]|nr:transcriptional regulator GcvA [Rhodospirillales bacterium]
MNKLPPLNGLRSFEAAARHNSFKSAAQELNVTPAAISHQVKNLELFLGVELFERMPRGLKLTEAGRGYLPGLTAGFETLVKAGSRLKEKGVEGRLSISALASFGKVWLIPRIPRFLERYPDLSVDIFYDETSVDFRKDPFDIGIRYGLGIYPGLYSKLIMTEEVYPVCSPMLLNGPHPLTKFSDLKNFELVHDCAALTMEPSTTWGFWLAQEGVKGIEPNKGLGVSDSNALIDLLLTGYGVGIGRSSMTKEHLAAGRLVRPFAESRPSEFSHFVVTPEPSMEQPKVKAFFDWVQEEVDRDSQV